MTPRVTALLPFITLGAMALLEDPSPRPYRSSLSPKSPSERATLKERRKMERTNRKRNRHG